MATTLHGMNIIVNEAFIKNNHLPNGDFKLEPQITRKIQKKQDHQNIYQIEMSIEIHDNPNSRFPFDLIANLSGIFNIESDNEDEIMDFLKNQGVQMVYPHLRALVTSLTANALMPPIILPIIYTNQFEEKQPID